METYGEFESANDHIADPDNLDELFEAIIIEMMSKGIPAEKSQIQTLLVKLSQNTESAY